MIVFYLIDVKSMQPYLCFYSTFIFTFSCCDADIQKEFCVAHVHYFNVN